MQNTIQCFKRDKPLTTKILLYLVNLKELVLCDIYGYHINNWDCLENLSLPSLQILKSYNIPIKYLSNLIKNTNGSLIEIKINHFEIDDGKIIQVIYQNCPKLKYLKLPFENSNILKLDNLLINCNNLNELQILIQNNDIFDWNNLFNILIKSSPINLFKFKFNYFSKKPIELKSFLYKWKGKRPMLLQFDHINSIEMNNLIEKCKAEGIIEINNDLNHDW